MEINIDASEKIVVEGYMSNEKGPYFIRISTNKGNIDYTKLVISISDNEGNIDCLQMLKDTMVLDGPFFMSLPYPNYDGGFDYVRYPLALSNFKGIYYTTYIQGVIGNTYTLRVSYNAEQYTATEKMLPVAEIDSMHIGFKQSNDDKEIEQYIPYIYFREPKDQKNYYLFDYGYHPINNLSFDGVRYWIYTVLDDTLLPENVNDLSSINNFYKISKEIRQILLSLNCLILTI